MYCTELYGNVLRRNGMYDLVMYCIKGKIVGFPSIQQPPDCPIQQIFFDTEQAHNGLEWHLDNNKKK